MEILSNPTVLQVLVVILAAFSTASIVLNYATLRQSEGLTDLLRQSIKLLNIATHIKAGATLAPPVVREVLPVGPVEEEELTQEQMEAIFSTSGALCLRAPTFLCVTRGRVRALSIR